MDKQRVTFWYDQEGDFMEVTWDKGDGYYTETCDDRVMVKVDTEGHVLGFHVLGFSTVKGEPLNVPLAPIHEPRH